MLIQVQAKQARSVINGVKFYTRERTLFVNVNADIALPTAATEAIHSGIALSFQYQFKIKSDKWYQLTAKAQLQKTYRLSYSRMTRKYRIENPVTFEVATFDNLSSSVKFMQRLKHFPLILVSQLPKGKRYLKVRFHLMSDNLPSSVSVERLFKSDWDTDSKWTTWQIP